jgi:hypothetical protein
MLHLFMFAAADVLAVDRLLTLLIYWMPNLSDFHAYYDTIEITMPNLILLTLW